MAWTLVTTATFDRRARKFLVRHPELRPRFAEVLRKLSEDPLAPSLRLHALRGNLQGVHAIRLTHSFRITLLLHLAAEEVVLLDMGSHDEVYR